MKKMLVIYYSWANCNTKRIAEQLAQSTGADIARIETVHPYSGSYEEVVLQGKKEIQDGVKPQIKPLAHTPDNYDVIAIGTPTWWYTMAPAVSAFFNQYDLKGKTVIPFITHGGWPGHAIEDMKKSCKGAVIIHEMEVRFDSNGGDHMETSQSAVDSWIEEEKKDI